MSVAREIEERIESLESGSVFIPSDFHDIASIDNANAVLSRMAKDGKISRVLRGIYAKPKRIGALGKDVPPSPNAVAEALARNNRWTIAPAGDAALNQLGLDTQVPAVYEYVSSGPYKSYGYGKFTIQMKHRASRDLLDYSPTTRLIIQALKALGKDAATDELAGRLARRLSDEEVSSFYGETQNASAWIFEFAKKLKEARGC